jgi:hypothetical protein
MLTGVLIFLTVPVCPLVLFGRGGAQPRTRTKARALIHVLSQRTGDQRRVEQALRARARRSGANSHIVRCQLIGRRRFDYQANAAQLCTAAVCSNGSITLRLVASA